MIPELGTPGLVGQYRNRLLSRNRARGATAYCPFSCFGGYAYCPTAYCPAPGWHDQVRLKFQTRP